MTSPEQYTPRSYSELDWIAAAKRTADAILRSNPLTNAVITKGLTQWRGNHVDINGDKVEYIWFGDFLPADSTMGGIPQKGVVFRRDDSTAASVDDGMLAFALYDHDPGGGGLGLRQTIHWGSLDGDRLMSESREGGQQWPQENIAMGPLPREKLDWVKTPTVPDNAWWTLWEGRANILGNNVVARYWAATTNGAAGEFRLRVEGGGGDIIGPIRSLGVNTDFVFEDTVSVIADRGDTRTIRLEARTTNTTGFARMQCISARCYSP